MKKLTFILIGAGNRGKCYTQHAYMHGGYELVGIADPNEQTREFMREHYHIPKENCYKTYDELLAREKIVERTHDADIVVTNKTPLTRAEIDKMQNVKFVALRCGDVGRTVL